jgi:hypothetical protein
MHVGGHLRHLGPIVAFGWQPSGMQQHHQALSSLALLDLLHSKIGFAILQGTCWFWQLVGQKL